MAREIYDLLKNIVFDGDDRENPGTWSGNDEITRYVNQAITDRDGSLAYYIAPIGFAFNSQGGIEDAAKHICKQPNDHYSISLDKPFIFIANTLTVHAASATDTSKTGGSHWISWVLLPRNYQSPFGKKNSDKYQLLFFDSTAEKNIPEKLKEFLTNDKTIIENGITIKLSALCSSNEIEFINCKHLTGHQMNGSDCGWWAVYYSLMTVYTGSTDFLEPHKGKKLSAIPLRRVINIAIGETLVTKKDHHSATEAKSTKKREEYAASGLKHTLHGNIYQLKLLMLFLWRGYKKGYSFTLATEMDDAEKFDDVVLRYSDGPGKEVKYRFLQAKHKFEGKINVNDLFDEKDGNFSLQKYFISYRKIQAKFPDGKLIDFIICTNIGFDFTKHKKLDLKKSLRKIDEEDEILSVKSKKIAVRYCFKKNFNKKYIFKLLMRTSDLIMLAKEIANYLLSERKFDLRSQIFKIYHIALAKEVIYIKGKCFRKNFIENNASLSAEAKNLREILITKLENNDLSKIKLDLSKTFGNEKNSSDASNSLPNDNITEEQINNFLDHLIFAVSQPNEDGLGKIIEGEIGQEFNLISSNIVYDQFQREMLDWMKARKGTFLFSEDAKEFFEVAKQRINKLVLIGPTLEYRARLKKYGIGFNSPLNLHNFLDSEKQICHVVASNSVWISCIKVCDFLQTIAAYQKDDGYISAKLSSLLLLQERLIHAFSEEQSLLLVIEYNRTLDENEEQEFFETLSGILKKHKTKKVIIIGNTEAKLAKLLKSDLAYEEINDGKNDFASLMPETQDHLKSKTVNFQGRKMSLAQIAADGLNEVVDAVALAELIVKDDIAIGLVQAELNAAVSNYYIDRIFYRQIVINQKCLEKNINDLFTISGDSRDVISEFFPTRKKIVWLPNDPVELDNNLGKSTETDNFDETKQEEGSNTEDHFYGLLSNNPEKYFNELKSKLSGKNIHWFKVQANKLVWCQTHGEISGIRSYINHSTLSDYVAEDLFLNRVAIIAAEPGMGKSTVLTRISERLKEQDHTLWVIRINLSEHKNLIDRQNFNSIASVISFLSDIQNLTNSLGRNLLAYYFSQHGKVVVLFDSFDEISVFQQQAIVQLVKLLLDKSKVKICITTRLHYKTLLENACAVFAHSLRPFTEVDREHFIKNFWISALQLAPLNESNERRLKEFISQLLQKFSMSTSDNESKFVGIPLQARMLAEVFLEEFRTFYYSDDEDPELPEILDIRDLYLHFIETKYNIFFAEKANLLGSVSSGLIASLKISFGKMHQRLAFKLLFPMAGEEFLPNINKNLFNNDEMQSFGLVQFDGEKSIFLHRTFAEFFVAELLINLLTKSDSHIKSCLAIKFLLENIFKENNQVVYFFIKNGVSQLTNRKLKENWHKINNSCLSVNSVFASDIERLYPETLCLDISFDTDNLGSEDGDENKLGEDLISINFSGLTEKLKSYCVFLQKPEIYEAKEFISDFFQIALNITDLKQLKKALSNLKDIFCRTGLWVLKDLISNNITLFIDHYIIQLIVQYSVKKITLDINLFSVFFQEKELLKKFYLKLMKILLEPNLNFNNLINYFIENNSENFLVKILEKIPQTQTKENIKAVGNFLISKRDVNCMFLVKFLEIFSDLQTAENFAAIYENKDLLWLERDGIQIAIALIVLTPAMASKFASKLNMSYARAGNKIYATNIFKKLIIILLDKLHLNDLPSVDKYAFLDILICFLKFSIKYSMYLSISDKQLVSAFKLIEKLLNKPLISPKALAMSIEGIFALANAAQLKLIDTGSALLVIDPASDFEVELTLWRRTSIIMQLIRWKLQNPEGDFDAACRKVVAEMLLLPIQQFGLLATGSAVGNSRKRKAVGTDNMDHRWLKRARSLQDSSITTEVTQMPMEIESANTGPIPMEISGTDNSYMRFASATRHRN